MTSNGKVVRSRAVRELSGTVTLEDLNKLISTPHDPTGTFTSSKNGVPDLGRPVIDAGPEREAEVQTSNRAYITNDVVQKFGPTNDCKKCRAVMEDDRNCRFVAHSSECRARMEVLTKEDDSFRRRVEEAGNRKTRNIAEKIEKNIEKDEEAKREKEVKGKE